MRFQCGDFVIEPEQGHLIASVAIAYLVYALTKGRALVKAAIQALDGRPGTTATRMTAYRALGVVALATSPLWVAPTLLTGKAVSGLAWVGRKLLA